MDVKAKAKFAYDSASEYWHKSRATDLSSTDEKLLKQNRPHLFVEKPAMQAKLPDLTGKDILCLGCGSGEECGFILAKNPKSLTGIDLSEKLIEIAKKTVKGVEFFQMDAEGLTFDDAKFDYIYCSLMMDYFESWDKVLSQVKRVLKDGGTFLFSNLHPVKWSAARTFDEDGKATSSLIGFKDDEKTGATKIYGDYLNTNVHEETWMKSISLAFYSKSISQMFKEITDSGLKVIDLVEPKAIEVAKKYDKDYWALNQRIPNFVIFECKK